MIELSLGSAQAMRQVLLEKERSQDFLRLTNWTTYFQEFLLNAIHNVVHGVAHAGTHLMYNVLGKEKREAPEALSAKEEVEIHS